MSKPSIVCVVPSIRESMMESFRKSWAPLFERHGVTLITVWDGGDPRIEEWWPEEGHRSDGWGLEKTTTNNPELAGLICRQTDAVRNYGFWRAACGGFDFILTLDDDVHPPAGSDPIQEHLDVLNRRVPTSWMNTAMDEGFCSWKDNKVIPGPMFNGPIPYLRGFPYGIRDEAPVMASHGVWVNVPDFDGKTQLELTANGTRPQDLPYSLPYFRGPVPKGCFMPICGMNLMIRKEALPYLYFAPMGPDSGVVTDCTHCGHPGSANFTHVDCCPDGLAHNRSGLNRFADIWMGLALKQHCDKVGWAIYTGASTVIHTRASDPFKNVEQEALGIKWNEWLWRDIQKSWMAYDKDRDQAYLNYLQSWSDKANRFRDIIKKLQER